jgi:flavin-binding protein dodecin
MIRQSSGREERHMSIAKVITVIGSSPESFAKAADAAVQEAAKTVRRIHGAQVVSMSATVEKDRIKEYRTTVEIAFGIERASADTRSAEETKLLAQLQEIQDKRRREEALTQDSRSEIERQIEEALQRAADNLQQIRNAVSLR